MKLIKSIIAMCVLSFPVAAFSAGTATGTITHVFLTATFGNLIYVELSGTKTGNPTCSTRTPWQFVIPPNSDQEYGVMLGILMAAQQKGATVTIVGQGICNIDNSMETILSIEY